MSGSSSLIRLNINYLFEKGKLMSLIYRLILINSALSSISLYYFFLFRMPKWIVKAIDKIRKHFLWVEASSSPIRKYYLIKWKSFVALKSLEDGEYPI
jgi:hypothetical protein